MAIMIRRSSEPSGGVMMIPRSTVSHLERQ